MFEPEVFGLTSSVLWSLTQALVTPTLGFLFLYLMKLPLVELPLLPGKVKYKPPPWVPSVFAHGLTFTLVLTTSTILFLNRTSDHELADSIKPELFVVRDLDPGDKPPTKTAIVVKQHDGFSNFRIFANGYHVFSSTRDCATTFQCSKNAAQAEADAKEFKQLRVSGGSLYDLSKTNSLPHEIVLNHYLAKGDNYIDLISENSSTGACELGIDVVLEKGQDAPQRHQIHISPERGGTEPKHRGPLAVEELFYSAGQRANPDTVEPYKTSAHERRNAICARIRITLKLSAPAALALSTEETFRSRFLDLQKAYVCETIGSPIPGCENRP